MQFNKTVKIQNQGAAVMTVPKGILQILGLTYGDAVELSVDFDRKCFVGRKQGEGKLPDTKEQVKEKVEYIKYNAKEMLSRLLKDEEVDKTEIISILEVLGDL